MFKYRSVLSVPGAPRLLASGLVGRLPLGMSSLAILLLVRGATRSYAAAGLAVGAYAFAARPARRFRAASSIALGGCGYSPRSPPPRPWCWSAW